MENITIMTPDGIVEAREKPDCEPAVSVRHLNDGAAPSTRTAAASDVGRGILNMSADRVLTVGYILKPLFVKASRIKCGQYRMTGELTVARISPSLKVGAV